MSDYYGNLETLLKTSGVQPSDFGLEDVDGLTALLNQWFGEAKAIIDAYCKRDFLTEGKIPMLVHHCADRLVANMIALAQARRGSPVVRVGDYTIRMTDDNVLTQDIEDILRLLPKGVGETASIRVLAITGEEDEDNA